MYALRKKYLRRMSIKWPRVPPMSWPIIASAQQCCRWAEDRGIGRRPYTYGGASTYFTYRYTMYLGQTRGHRGGLSTEAVDDEVVALFVTPSRYRRPATMVRVQDQLANHATSRIKVSSSLIVWKNKGKTRQEQRVRGSRKRHHVRAVFHTADCCVSIMTPPPSPPPQPTAVLTTYLPTYHGTMLFECITGLGATRSPARACVGTLREPDLIRLTASSRRNFRVELEASKRSGRVGSLPSVFRRAFWRRCHHVRTEFGWHGCFVLWGNADESCKERLTRSISTAPSVSVPRAPQTDRQTTRDGKRPSRFMTQWGSGARASTTDRSSDSR
ncbi:hypothetical protein LX32DRAFT_278642 [Colletotrichum zoysiae]|uniref:Uncharacterized protein n=1 Tax=Colletotrichum zoysiae TaxID=1216348 RepID=A0AAD9H2I4_9PEZI|nr:hypothetical protein LX32DRAFT_278642 [Colletotrichum zoysiae]